MSGFWHTLFRENPMHIETLRALRRFNVVGGLASEAQNGVARVLIGILFLVYAWFLVTIVIYHEDMSQGILFFEFGLLTLLVPGSLYGAISGERERLTWDSLIMTPLSPGRILTGKLIWRLGMAGAILLIGTPPLLLTHFATHYTRSYTLGGLLWMQFCIAAWCVFLAAFTLWVSARTKRSVVSLSVVTVTLLVVLALVPGLMSVFGIHPDISIQAAETETLSPMVYLGSLLVHLNPGYMLAVTESLGASNRDPDFWQRAGIFTVLPYVYLLLAAFCAKGTLSALARLGLPGGTGR